MATIAASVGMLVLGLSTGRFVYAALSPIGFLIGLGDLGFARKPYPSPMAWWYEHMNSMLGGGVAFHTAFFVLGAGRLFGISMDGPWAVVPWLLPTIVGVPVSAIWTSVLPAQVRRRQSRGRGGDELTEVTEVIAVSFLNARGTQRTAERANGEREDTNNLEREPSTRHVY